MFAKKYFTASPWILSIFVPCILGTAGPLQQNKYPAPGAERWLWAALESYPTWIKNSKLDPTPVMEESNFFIVNSSQVVLDFEIRNFYVQNFSNNIQISKISADLGYYYNWMMFNYNLTSAPPTNYVLFAGEFKAAGTVGGNSISAGGNWRLTFNNIGYSVEFEDIQVTPDGYFSILYPSYQDFDVMFNGLIDFQFDGLLDNLDENLAALVKLNVLEKLKQYIAKPAEAGFLRYFQESFEKTPLEDILDGNFVGNAAGH